MAAKADWAARREGKASRDWLKLGGAGLVLAIAGPMAIGSITYPIIGYRFLLISAAVAGLFMGMPFPKLVASLGGSDRRLLPWAWAINGFLSVIGAPVAALVSVTAGFPALFLTAAVAYSVAAGSGFSLASGRCRAKR